MIILFNIWVLPYLGYGPLWKAHTQIEAQYCRQNWWQNLLFISTMTQKEDLCMLSTWYLSTDFQLFLISLTLIYLISKYPSHRAPILTGACVVAHTVPSIVIYFTNNVSFWMLSIREFRENVRIPGGYVSTTYDKFYIRMPPYIIGVCTAYITDYMIKKKFSITQIQKLSLFFTMVSLTFLVYILGALFYLPGQEYNVWQHVVFAVPHRLVWAATLGIGLTVHICCGYGAASSFFTLPMWVVLGRLSYHMYLLNYLLIPLDIFVGQSSNYVNSYLFTLRVLGDVTFITVLAYVTTILLELPMEKLRRRYLPR